MDNTINSNSSTNLTSSFWDSYPVDYILSGMCACDRYQSSNATVIIEDESSRKVFKTQLRDDNDRIIPTRTLIADSNPFRRKDSSFTEGSNNGLYPITDCSMELPRRVSPPVSPSNSFSTATTATMITLNSSFDLSFLSTELKHDNEEEDFTDLSIFRDEPDSKKRRGEYGSLVRMTQENYVHCNTEMGNDCNRKRKFVDSMIDFDVDDDDQRRTSYLKSTTKYHFEGLSSVDQIIINY